MSEFLTKAEFEKLASDGAVGTAFVESPDVGVTLCGEPESGESVTLGGQTFVSDDTKGFVLFAMAHSFPVVTAFGQALLGDVIDASWKSLLYQPFNWEHKLVAYDDSLQSDKILGSIVAAEFPRRPHLGWGVPDRIEDAPGITAVASFAKLARGMQNIVGREKSGRHKHTVSMEVNYPYSQSSFAVALNGDKPNKNTPDFLAKAGWDYVPWTEASEDLLACFSIKKRRIVSTFRGKKTVHLMGGLNSPVHFAGTGLCFLGAEPTAKILKMAASGTDDFAKQALAPLFTFVETVRKSAS